MVCEKCLKKQDKLVTDVRDRKIGVNMLLQSRRPGFNPGGTSKCKKCAKPIKSEAAYCSTCAYTDGRCSMCGIKVVDTKLYK
jgi:cysteine-rich PDZ-binding protein